MIEKQRIITLSRYRIKSYEYEVLSDFKIAFLREEGGATFCLFLDCFVYTQRQISLSSIFQVVFRGGLQLLSIFFSVLRQFISS